MNIHICKSFPAAALAALAWPGFPLARKLATSGKVAPIIARRAYSRQRTGGAGRSLSAGGMPPY